jgi:hypothetical protein
MSNKIVKVKWQDIIGDMVWNDENPEPLEIPVFETVGFLISADDEEVRICDTLPGYGNRCTFPAGCILEIEYIGVDEREFDLLNT